MKLRCMKSNWREEISEFRAWAIPNQEEYRGVEWQYDFAGWSQLYDSLEKWLDSTQPQNWKSNEVEDLLYIAAQDWGCGMIVGRYLKQWPESLLFLAAHSLEASDWDARWQIADVLGHLSPDPRIEPLLLRFANDEQEYVRRRALQSLARVSSPQAEQLALREWNRECETQQWARMNALSCWHHINSPLLEPHLREAEASDMQYLADYARRLRDGQTEPV